jgi:thymidylate synthase
VLKDRLNTEEDHAWFTEKLNDVMEINFRLRKKDGGVYFSNINKLESREYEEIQQLKKIISTIEEFQ